METAVLAGRFAGGRAYGYKRVIQLDEKGELVRGLLAIDDAKADNVRPIINGSLAACLPSRSPPA